MIQAILHASELLTGKKIAAKDGRKITEDDLQPILDGAIVHDDKAILWSGKTSALPKKFLKSKRTNLNNRSFINPGWVDCHTHLIFAGNRADEFAKRCGGATYQEIAQAGGGILNTVRATRDASEAELFKLGLDRLQKMYDYGVRVVEIKSGYGLDKPSEHKILKVIQRLKKTQLKSKKRQHIVSTYMGAHAVPQGVTKASYVQEIEDSIDEIKKWADCFDVFIDEGYFSRDDGEKLFEAAQKKGLSLKLHADELGNTESAALGAKWGALSADHLLKISDQGVQALANSQTVAVLLPGTAFFLKQPYAPAKKLIDAGAAVAIASDFNPGTCPCLSLPTIMTIAALYQSMSRAQIFAAITYNAAKALGLTQTLGTLEIGKKPIFTILPYQRFEESYYLLG